MAEENVVRWITLISRIVMDTSSIILDNTEITPNFWAHGRKTPEIPRQIRRPVQRLKLKRVGVIF